MTITVPLIPKSQNEVMRMHHFRQREYLHDMASAVKACVRGRPGYSKARVTITYYFPNARRRDPDNYTGGGAKGLIDGLVRAGVIVDDSFAHIELAVRGRVDPANPRTEITVEPLGEEEGHGANHRTA